MFILNNVSHMQNRMRQLFLAFQEWRHFRSVYSRDLAQHLLAAVEQRRMWSDLCSRWVSHCRQRHISTCLHLFLDILCSALYVQSLLRSATLLGSHESGATRRHYFSSQLSFSVIFSPFRLCGSILWKWSWPLLRREIYAWTGKMLPMTLTLFAFFATNAIFRRNSWN